MGDGRAADATPGFAEPTFGQRLLARVVDGLILLPLSLLVSLLTDGRVRSAIGFVIVAVYEVTFLVRRGRTPGKMALGTFVLDRRTGGFPSPRQATLRWLVLAGASVVSVVVPELDGIEILCALVVLAPVLRPPLHRGLHDLAAGTIVSASRSR